MALDFPEIDPVALSLGPIEIRWYALAYLTGFLLGWKYCQHLVNKYFSNLRPNAEDFDDFLSWAVIGVILGGRIGYMLFYQFDYYLAYPVEALKIWNGGMSFHGGMLGVIVSMFLFSWVRKTSVLRLADLVAMAVPIGLFFGRVANFVNGELYGRAADVAWAVRFPTGGDVPRHPSQLYEAALEGGLLFIVMFFLFKSETVRKYAGVMAGVFLIGYGLSRSVVEFFREPDEHLGLLWDVISMGQLLSLPMIISGVFVVIFAVVYQKKFGTVR